MEITMITSAEALPEIKLDEYGLLTQPQLWSKEVALSLANDLKIIPLTADHWKIINAMRKHYERFGVAPAMHNICHNNNKGEGWIHGLFGNCLNAWRVAGLPDPGEEAKAYLNDM
jgi:dissimilatory sulfite reductase related protein